MKVEIVTKEDLEEFRQRLLIELSEIMGKRPSDNAKEYLRSREVRKLLGGISSGTLQNLRIKGLLHPTKIEGVFYYRQSEVTALLNAGTGA